jgi:ankyrin repeat protein
MAPSYSAPNELAKLLLCIVTTLPPETHPLVLRHLPVPELARLSCVHKAFHVAWKSLQGQLPGELYAPPTADDFQRVKHCSRLERAAAFGDVAVIRSMVAAGVDEHGTPLLEAQGQYKQRIVDHALCHAAGGGDLLAAELLLDSGADVHFRNGDALQAASKNGHTAVVQLLIQHGADVHAGDDNALWWASWNGHLAVAELLIQHGANVHAVNDYALQQASENGHTAVVQLLIQHGADVHAVDEDGYDALQLASRNGHTDVVQLLIQHGADVHAVDDRALHLASQNGHATVVQILVQHGADVHAVDDAALRLASKNGHTDVEKILQHGKVMPTEAVHDDEDEDY